MKPSKRSRLARGLAVFLCWVVNFAAWVTLWDHDLVSGWLAAIAITVVLSFFAILVHELGHALAARLLRIRILAIAVGPFELRFRPIRLTEAADLDGDIGGYVMLEDDEFGSMRKDAIVAAAGPGANFALALIATILALGLHSYDWVTTIPRTDGFLPSSAEMARSFAESKRQELAFSAGAVANALAILSTGMGLFNLFPFAGSDGDVIARWVRFKWPGWRVWRG